MKSARQMPQTDPLDIAWVCTSCGKINTTNYADFGYARCFKCFIPYEWDAVIPSGLIVECNTILLRRVQEQIDDLRRENNL